MTRLFVHIPKNGGMTIRKAPPLKGRIITANAGNHRSPEYTDELHRVMAAAGEHHGDEHARWRDFREDLRRDHRAFAIVRNPWSRVVSRFTFALHASRQGSHVLPKGWDFGRFLDERFEYGGRPFYWHRAIHGWFPQVDYVTDEAGNLRCDVLRFEHYAHDVGRYFKMPVQFPVRNVSNGIEQGNTVVGRVDYRTFYRPRQHDMVAEWYAEDINFFGFDFDSAAKRNVTYGGLRDHAAGS